MAFTCMAPVLLENVKNVRRSSDYAFHKVRCGKCLNCVKKRKLDWIFRLSQESKSRPTLFLTLTYSDDNLVYGYGELPTLERKVYPSFMKRLRTNISRSSYKSLRLSYYAVGEYGSATHRPHYHSILFGLPYDISRSFVEEAWNLGFVDIQRVNPARIAYVVGYVNKKLLNQDKPFGVEPEFSLMSKGLGKSYLTDEMVDYYRKRELPYLLVEDGVKASMPRYYKDRIYVDEDVRQRVVDKSRDYVSDDLHPDDVKYAYVNFQKRLKKRN